MPSRVSELIWEQEAAGSNPAIPTAKLAIGSRSQLDRALPGHPPPSQPLE